MRWLFLVLFVFAVLFFLTLPVWVAVAFALVLIWTAGLLYLIFHHSDRLTTAIEELQDMERR